MWEYSIKAGKLLLTEATKNVVLTFEELVTVLCRVECILNSRPLCCKSHADQFIEIITPRHFLIGDHLLNRSAPENLEISLGRRFIHAREVIESFWNFWSQRTSAS